MFGSEAPAAVCALVVAVAVGLLAHEWSHALALRAGNVEYTVEILPGRTGGVLAALASCPWALVRPLPSGREPAWVLRLAALMPLTLTVPVLVGAGFGFLPSADAPVATAALVGWTACALPSPQDFSVVWHAPRILERATIETDATDTTTPDADDTTAATPSRA